MSGGATCMIIAIVDLKVGRWRTLAATALTGCLGFVGGGGDYGGEVVVPEPDLVIFGGGYDRGRDVHDYSHRGHESREVAHPAARGGGEHREKR